MEPEEAQLPEQRSSWVPNPALYILMHEPPAISMVFKAPFPNDRTFYHWHFARGKTDVPGGELKRDNQKFISPILFVDGHSASHDFTATIQADPRHIYERTANWMWYKPKDVQPPPPISLEPHPKAL